MFRHFIRLSVAIICMWMHFAPPLYAASILDVTRAWEQRRSRINSLRSVAEGERIIPAGALDSYIDDGVAEFPEGTKPPIPAEEYRSPYVYSCLYDFRNHRARVEMNLAIFVPETVSFQNEKSLRAFDGEINRKMDPLNSTDASNTLKLMDNLPYAFGYTCDFPVLLACGYTPPQELPQDARHCILSSSSDQLAVVGEASLDGKSVVVVRSKPYFGNPGNYDEYWTDPKADYEVVQWIRYQGGIVRDKIKITYDDDRPITISQTQFLPDNKVAETYTVTVNEWEVNVPVEKSDFVLTATSGMLVLDGKTNKRYIVNPEAPASMSRRILLGLTIVVVICLSLLLLRKRTRQLS